MKSNPATQSPKTTQSGKPLAEVLGQSERVKELVEECGEDLSSVNTDLKQQLTDLAPMPGVEKVLEKSKSIEGKVDEATEELSIVNRALENEVRERHALEHRLAAVTEQEEASRHASFHDPLTGLPNRALFDDRLEHGLEQAKRHHRILAVMFLDLDGFKGINDTHGHDVGDSVLQTIAGRLKENTRSDDTVSRHGGDEFLYLLTEVQNEGDVTLVAEKIVKAIEEPFDVTVPKGTVSLRVDASVGIAIFPKNGTTADSLVKSADTAMYLAKRSKSKYSFAS
jgi:diguanylate cyclase (GGDEF)-like protein